MHGKRAKTKCQPKNLDGLPGTSLSSHFSSTFHIAVNMFHGFHDRRCWWSMVSGSHLSLPHQQSCTLIMKEKQHRKRPQPRYRHNASENLSPAAHRLLKSRIEALYVHWLFDLSEKYAFLFFSKKGNNPIHDSIPEYEKPHQLRDGVAERCLKLVNLGVT